jgi:hypothetical protein
MPQIKSFRAYDYFNRFNIKDRDIPSEESIDLILSEIDNEPERIQFCMSNNEVVNNTESLLYPNDEEGNIYLRLLIELVENYQKQHEVIGSNNFILFCQSLVVVNWFAAMVAKMKETNSQKSRKIASKHLALFKSADPIEFDNHNKNHEHRYSALNRFPEFAESMQFLIDWYEKASILSNENTELRKLIINEKILIQQIQKKIRDSKNPYENKCQFCQKIFKSNKGGGHKTCGSDECKKKYYADTKRKSRSQPHEIDRRSRPPEAFGGKRNFCDECTKRRQLYQVKGRNLCNECVKAF